MLYSQCSTILLDNGSQEVCSYGGDFLIFISFVLFAFLSLKIIKFVSSLVRAFF